MTETFLEQKLQGVPEHEIKLTHELLHEFNVRTCLLWKIIVRPCSRRGFLPALHLLVFHLDLAQEFKVRGEIVDLFTGFGMDVCSGNFDGGECVKDVKLGDLFRKESVAISEEGRST